MSGLRDWSDQILGHVANCDPNFAASETSLRAEFLPEPAEYQALEQADRALSMLERNREEASWQADSLKLARDCTVAAKIVEKFKGDAKTERLARITHLREQNLAGANFVQDYAQKHCKFVFAERPDLEIALAEVSC